LNTFFASHSFLISGGIFYSLLVCFVNKKSKSPCGLSIKLTCPVFSGHQCKKIKSAQLKREYCNANFIRSPVIKIFIYTIGVNKPVVVLFIEHGKI